MTRRFRYCPTCRHEMDRDLVGSVIIEVCPNHGSWFDAGELRTFAEHNDTPALWEDTVREEFDPSEGERTHCPACNSGTLQAGVLRGFTLSLCTQCDGFFLPLQSLERLAEMFPLRQGTSATTALKVLVSFPLGALLNVLKRLGR